MAKPIVPSDWKTVISNAKLYRPFMIIEMDQADIIDLYALSQRKIKKNVPITMYV